MDLLTPMQVRQCYCGELHDKTPIPPASVRNMDCLNKCSRFQFHIWNCVVIIRFDILNFFNRLTPPLLYTCSPNQIAAK
ncbi:CFC_HP_G0057310.mRNA.1.CDS.1 [Saccharomyces cerevisiae]|nr:CFC_HP_G0057310.mRNA.1.CDS.1 [Saccharomyces cerevisiae]CAI6541491.1 CFC_HP_G0057310.mRNA.1.CDS.1 [Saccharomyces cerevisiae]